MRLDDFYLPTTIVSRWNLRVREFVQDRATTRHFCLQDSALNDFKHESLLHNSQQAPQATKPPSFVPP
jgi:hypothetical protein